MTDLNGYEPNDPCAEDYADRYLEAADDREEYPDVVFDEHNLPVGLNGKKLAAELLGITEDELEGLKR
jgi:hypothetical protein